MLRIKAVLTAFVNSGFRAKTMLSTHELSEPPSYDQMTQSQIGRTGTGPMRSGGFGHGARILWGEKDTGGIN
ncbi:MAG: hypothetical protein AAB900_02060 [Patescibacteria group bacterium]